VRLEINECSPEALTFNSDKGISALVLIREIAIEEILDELML